MTPLPDVPENGRAGEEQCAGIKPAVVSFAVRDRWLVENVRPNGDGAGSRNRGTLCRLDRRRPEWEVRNMPVCNVVDAFIPAARPAD